MVVLSSANSDVLAAIEAVGGEEMHDNMSMRRKGGLSKKGDAVCDDVSSDESEND